MKPIVMTDEEVRRLQVGGVVTKWVDVDPQPEFLANPDTVYLYRQSPFETESGMFWVQIGWQARSNTGQWWHEVEEGHELHNWAWINRAWWLGEKPPKWLPAKTMPVSAAWMVAAVTDAGVMFTGNKWEWWAKFEITACPDFFERAKEAMR